VEVTDVDCCVEEDGEPAYPCTIMTGWLDGCMRCLEIELTRIVLCTRCEWLVNFPVSFKKVTHDLPNDPRQRKSIREYIPYFLEECFSLVFPARPTSKPTNSSAIRVPCAHLGWKCGQS